ncbi:MAG: hypothetical protein IK093_19855 [Ruminiclostridium sp.]|nr:hypothetical protein [Ruminiclostridium sp.]
MAAGAIIAKVAATVLSDKKGREIVLILITAILMPIILLVLMVISIFSGTANANVSLVDCCFKNAAIPSSYTDEQKALIENMKMQLESIDKIIAGKENAADYDANMVKAVFYCLQFGAEPSDDDEVFDLELFCDCFAGIPFSEIDRAYENISENFPDLKVTDNVKFGVENIYKYLTEGVKR